MSNDDIVDMLNDFIEICKDGEYGFCVFVEYLCDLVIKQFFVICVEDCCEVVVEL